MKVLVLFLLFCSAILAAGERTWTDAASGRTLTADFVSANNGSVTLRRAADGREFTLPLGSLIEADQMFVEERSKIVTVKVDADCFEPFNWNSTDSIRGSGKPDRLFRFVDEAIVTWAYDKSVAAAVVAVSENGEIIYERAFGYQDALRQERLQTATVMRLASISKPITAAVAKTLIRDGKLQEADTVWQLLNLDGKAPPGVDARWKDITIGHLLKHGAGWDREGSGAVSFMAPKIAEDTGAELNQLTFGHMLLWMLQQPLDFDPGSKEAYSNFGYSLLAHVCATVCGKPWIEVLKETVGQAAGMTTLSVSASDVAKRAPGETWYHYHPEYTEEPEVMPLRMELKQGSGSLACSAGDYCRFLEKYWISGEPRDDKIYNYTFFGSMPGTTAICRQMDNGFSFVIIGNRRSDSPEDWTKDGMDAVELMEKALELVFLNRGE